jgi:hypothetical protein
MQNDDSHTTARINSEMPTDLNSEFDSKRASPGEPFPVKVAFSVPRLKRINLECGDEMLTAWIRDAVRGVMGVSEEDVSTARPADYIPVHDTDPDDLAKALEVADPDDIIIFTVEFAGATLAALADADLGETMEERVREAVTLQLVMIERNIQHRPEITVEVPQEIAERARLKAQYWTGRHDDKSERVALLDALIELVELQTTYVDENGDVIASFVGGGE